MSLHRFKAGGLHTFVGQVRRMITGGIHRLITKVMISICVVSFLSWNRLALALDPNKVITQYVHSMWQVGNGLPHNTVKALIQTRDGYLWLGTHAGLTRFDGVRFTTFNKRNTEAIKNDNIQALCEDRDGNLWIGTYGGGLIRFKNGTFTGYTTKDGLSHNIVMSVSEDRAGNLWIGTEGGGLNRFEDGTFTVYTTREGLLHNTVMAIFEDRAGNVWVGTSGGLNRFQDGRVAAYLTQAGFSGNIVWSFCEDRAGNLWIGTEAGLNLFKNGGLTLYAPTPLPFHNGVRVIHEDRHGNLWIGTYRGGLFRFKNGTFTSFTTNQGLSDDRVQSLCEDREGSLWIGTYGGLNHLKDGIFTAYTTIEGVSHNFVRAVYEDRAGNIWIGTEGGGLNRLNDGKVTLYTTKDGLSNNNVWSFLEDRAGNLWVGTAGGLNRFRNGEFTVYTTKDGLTHDGVRAIYEDRAGNLWIGTYGGGLNRFSDGKFIAYDKDVGSAPIWLLQEDRAGNLWIGTTGGLIRFRDGAVRVYTTKDGLSHDHIRSLYEDRDGTLWIGTYGGGLTRLKDGRFTVYTTRHGLFDDFAWQILEDGRENLWISCDRGIFRVSKRELDEFAQGKLSAVTAVAYGTAHGMKSLECNGGAQPAGCRGREGRLWFPTTKGVVVVDADHLPMNELRPPVMIEQVIIDQQPISITTRAWLSPGKGSFEFHYTALSFLEPEKVRFKYKLEGYDEDWIEAGTRRVAYYTNIPPGDYRFRVIACNNDGVWNEEGRAFDFSLAPRFYQTRWFYALWIVIIGLLVLGGHRLRTRQLVRRAEELEAKVARRTVELAEQKNKLAEANVRLEKAHEDLLAVFNQWRSGVIATDADGSIVFLNQTAQRLFGQSSDGVLGRSLGDMLSLTKPEQARLTALSQSPPSQRSKMTVSFEAPAGRRYWLELEVQDDPRDSRRKIVFLYDLTEVYDLRRLLDERSKFHELVGESRAMQLVYQQIRDLTKMDTTVLIEGETGTGKELVARAVHYASRRKNKPFIAVNCAGLTESLLASQLFGHRRGAFTGAVADQVGVFEAAHEGTLFLDEIGDMPPAVQVSLLRVLQEREITRLGDAKPRKVDVRVIAATNRDLNREVAEGRFRQDVLYRIQVVKIQLPPLRERPEDIPLLVAWFLEQIPAAEEKSLTEVSQEAMKAMMAYQWPGNVRELKSAVESAVIRCQGQILQLSDLPTHVTGLTAAPVISESEIEFKRQRVVEALERAGGNRVAAARLLGISRSTLYLWLDELGIKDDSNKR